MFDEKQGIKFDRKIYASVSKTSIAYKSKYEKGTTVEDQKWFWISFSIRNPIPISLLHNYDGWRSDGGAKLTINERIETRRCTSQTGSPRWSFDLMNEKKKRLRVSPVLS